MNNLDPLERQFQKNKDHFNEMPRKAMWKQLERRLDQKDGARKVKLYKVTAIAAMLAFVVAAVAYFNHYLAEHNPDYYVSNEGFSSLAFEHLNHEEEGLFNMASISLIRNAYAGAEISDVERMDLIGQYKSANGEIAFDIKLQEFAYQLDLGNSDFPVLELNKIEGSTIYFEGGQEMKMKLNNEAYGLQLLESNMLPEYSGFQFLKLSKI